MILRFATKRDKNGNRYYLIIDFLEGTFSRTPTHWFIKDDFVEITQKEMSKIKAQTIAHDFKEVNYLY